MTLMTFGKQSNDRRVEVVSWLWSSTALARRWSVWRQRRTFYDVVEHYLPKETSTDWPCFETRQPFTWIIEGKMRDKQATEKKRFQMLRDLATDDGHVALKQAAELRHRMMFWLNHGALRLLMTKWEIRHQQDREEFKCCRTWRFGVAVTRWSRSTQLLYTEPG